MLEIAFSDAVFERKTLRDRYDLLLGVVATLTVAVGSRSVYAEPLFPIVELRVALERWLLSARVDETDFMFESMESDEAGLVWIRRQPSGIWIVGSQHQFGPAADGLDFDDVEVGCGIFIEAVDQWVRSHLHREVREVFSAST